MKKYLVILIGVLFLIACKQEKKAEKEPFEMYQTSELAQLMEELYVYNDSIKQQILRGEQLSELPFDLQELHTAQMTDRFERDDSFNQFAMVYQQYQNQLQTTTNDSLKVMYNNTIQTCVACHQTSCTGPIPRIKKLLIE